MAILALATSGPAPAIGLRLATGAHVCQPIEAGRGRGRDVAPRLAELLERHHLTARDVRVIAVDVGPGSFTGVRVGVTLAKTLAYALHVPVLAVDSLGLLSASAAVEGPVVCLRDAGRGSLYHARYASRSDGRRACVEAPQRGDADAVRARQKGATLVGENVQGLARALGLEGPAVDVAADVGALLTLAADPQGQALQVPVHALAPMYLQASAPERLRAERRA